MTTEHETATVGRMRWTVTSTTGHAFSTPTAYPITLEHDTPTHRLGDETPTLAGGHAAFAARPGA